MVSTTFPLKTTLALIDKSGRVGTRPSISGKAGTTAKNTAWKNWPATLANLSAKGARIHLNLAAVAFPDDPCRVKLSLGSYQLEISGTVAHFRCYSQYAMCGVLFDFPDVDTEKAYLQMFEPVVIGTSLAPIETRPDTSGRHKEQYAGKNSALLTIWRQTPGGDVTSFDFRMSRYGVRWGTGSTELSTYGVEGEKAKGSKASFRPALKLKLKSAEKHEDSVPTIPLNEAQDEEVRWLFCLAVSNLSMSVADDVRRFLQSLVVA